MQLIFPDLTYEKTGGAENMVYEIVKVASRKRNISSVLIGSSKSFVVQRLSEDKIPFKFLEQDNFTIRNAPSSSDNLIINFHNFDGLSKLRDIKGKSIIWGILAPQILDWNRFGIEKKLTGRKILGNYFTKKLMVDMHRKSSLISMDGATSDALDGFVGNRINWPIISIPVDISSAIAPMARNSKSSTVLQVSYIGRSDNAWKIKPVKKFIRDINKIKNKIFNINIYTDSPAPFNEELKYSCDEHVSIVYHVGLYGPRIRTHLSEHSDLHFSMGTAALEGGLAGLPTILIDPCEQDLPEPYRYRWLFETEGNSLGRFLGAAERDFQGMEMSEVIETCLDEERRIETAEMCAQYVIENHSALTVTEKLLSLPAQATMEDICRFTPATWRSVTAAKALFAGI